MIKDVGLVNMNARVYDPEIGRFMSPDSIVQDPFDSQSLNRFSYVSNNPLSAADPTGHYVVTCTGSIIPSKTGSCGGNGGSAAQNFYACLGNCGGTGGEAAAAGAALAGAAASAIAAAGSSDNPQPSSGGNGNNSGVQGGVSDDDSIGGCIGHPCDLTDIGYTGRGEVHANSGIELADLGEYFANEVNGPDVIVVEAVRPGVIFAGCHNCSRRPDPDAICRAAQSSATGACLAAVANMVVCGVSVPEGGEGCISVAHALQLCAAAQATATAVCVDTKAAEQNQNKAEQAPKLTDKEREREAEKDYDVCRGLGSAGARGRCWASAVDRDGAREAGRPLPPLVTR